MWEVVAVRNGWLGQQGGPDLDHSNGRFQTSSVMLYCCFNRSWLPVSKGGAYLLPAGVKELLNWPVRDHTHTHAIVPIDSNARKRQPTHSKNAAETCMYPSIPSLSVHKRWHCSRAKPTHLARNIPCPSCAEQEWQPCPCGSVL